jgi:hypothetical protein
MGLFSRTPAAPPVPDHTVRGRVIRAHIAVHRSQTWANGDVLSERNLAAAIFLSVQGLPDPVVFVSQTPSHALIKEGDDVEVTFNKDGEFKGLFNHTFGGP